MDATFPFPASLQTRDSNPDQLTRVPEKVTPRLEVRHRLWQNFPSLETKTKNGERKSTRTMGVARKWVTSRESRPTRDESSPSSARDLVTNESCELLTLLRKLAGEDTDRTEKNNNVSRVQIFVHLHNSYCVECNTYKYLFRTRLLLWSNLR